MVVKFILLAEGRLVNLAAGDGHPAEIMDMTFALQAMSLKYVNESTRHWAKQLLLFLMCWMSKLLDLSLNPWVLALTL